MTSVWVRRPSVSEYRPIAMRCERSTGCEAAASWTTVNEVKRPSASTRVRGPERVHPGRLQPLPRPGRQVAPGDVLERGQQVGQGRVAVGVRGEVLPHPGQEVLPADVGHELLENGRALGVGDPVEVHLDRVDVRDVGRDRVRGGELVLLVRPRLPRGGERGPGLGPAGRLGLRGGARPGRERLVQPQVVPPAHGDQVAEPHVRHLVQDRLAAHLPARSRSPAT